MLTETDQLNRTFAALADPTRRAILSRLAAGEASVNEIAAPFEIPFPSGHQRLPRSVGGRGSAGGATSKPSSRTSLANANRLSRSMAHSGRARGAPNRSS